MATNYTTARSENLPAFNSTLKYACFDSFPFIRALKENALPIRLCCPGTRGAVKSRVDLTRVAPSGPYLTVPGPPRAQDGGLLCPGPGLHAASTSRNPNSAGRAPHSHPTEAPFWRRRAPAQSPAPRPNTSGTVGQTPRSGLCPQPGCPAPARIQQAARHPGIQDLGAGRVKGATDGAQPTGAPRTGRGRPPGNRARHREPAAQPAALVGFPPSPYRRPRSSLPPPLPGSAAPGPCPPAPVWAISAGGAATFQPGARRPEPRKQEEGEERRREGDTALAGALHSQKPSQSPVQPPPPPGRQGAQWAAGARWPG